MELMTNENDQSSSSSSSYRNSRTQQTVNFFDFDDDEDNVGSGGGNELIEPNNTIVKNSSISNQKNDAGTIKTAISSASNADNINLLSKEKLKNYFEIDSNVNQRIKDLIESTVETIIVGPNHSSSPSSSKLLTPRQSIERIHSGDQNVNLSYFRGKEQKLELLDYALLTADKYTMTKVILFLEHTLKQSIFFYELVRRPIAADHYLLYLRSTEQLDQQINVLNMMGRYEDAAFCMHTHAARTQLSSTADPQQQIKLLERSLLNFTAGGPEVTQWQSYIREHITLLEQQLPIEVDDRRRSEEASKQSSSSSSTTPTTNQQSAHLQEDNQLFVIFPRPSLVGLPLMETLRYCCLYHYKLPDNNFASPFHLKKTFKITDRQFLWVALLSLAQTGNRWTEIDSLFEYKSWLGSRKIRNIIPTNEIVEILYRNSAPPEMLEKYLDLVDDIEKKLQLAKEFHMNKYAADILIKLRDRKRLSELRSMIQTKFEMDYVQRYIDNALITSSIKWKN